MSGIVVAGAGQAGFQAAASLREAGFAGPITLVGDEPHLPYQRPPLSKAYLADKTDAAGLSLRPDAFFAEHSIALRLGTRVEAIDRAGRRLVLADGEGLPYDHLVLALGARNRPLAVPGAELSGIHQLRGLADADAVKAALAGAPRIVVVGAGFIGLEFAAVVAARGLDVTVVEAAARPMARAVSAQTGAFFRAAHEAAGIRFVFAAGVSAFEGTDGRVSALHLADGRALPAGSRRRWRDRLESLPPAHSPCRHPDPDRQDRPGAQGAHGPSRGGPRVHAGQVGVPRWAGGARRRLRRGRQRASARSHPHPDRRPPGHRPSHASRLGAGGDPRVARGGGSAPGGSDRFRPSPPRPVGPGVDRPCNHPAVPRAPLRRPLLHRPRRPPAASRPRGRRRRAGRDRLVHPPRGPGAGPPKRHQLHAEGAGQADGAAGPAAPLPALHAQEHLVLEMGL